jgi:hypothetical protein
VYRLIANECLTKGNIKFNFVLKISNRLLRVLTEEWKRKKVIAICCHPKVQTVYFSFRELSDWGETRMRFCYNIKHLLSDVWTFLLPTLHYKQVFFLPSRLTFESDCCRKEVGTEKQDARKRNWIAWRVWNGVCVFERERDECVCVFERERWVWVCVRVCVCGCV